MIRTVVSFGILFVLAVAIHLGCGPKIIPAKIKQVPFVATTPTVPPIYNDQSEGYAVKPVQEKKRP